MKNKTYEYPVRIYYEDTDAGGIVYHSQYLNFCERARTEWLRELGISQSDFLAQNIAFVVKKVEMDFISSAKLDDLVIVSSKVIEFKRASLVFEQEILNAHHQRIFIARVLIANVDLLRAKPCAIPESILGAFTRVC